MLEELPLRWDDFNREHILKHVITVEQVEEAYKDENKVIIATYGERIACVAAVVSGKVITMILARSYEAYYVVTARPASRKERDKYGK